MTIENRSAVILLSGGLDSATTLAIAMRQGFRCFAMTFRYGQRHVIELTQARRLAEVWSVAGHCIVDVDLRQFGGSALTDNIDVPKHGDANEIGTGIPITYVPARNTIFLSFALGWAEVLGATDIFLGVNALDYSGYPDCRPEYLEAFQRMARLATRHGVEGGAIRIQAPLLTWTKARIIQEGLALGVDYGMTTSCYDPTADGIACGHCDACLLRLKGFREAGLQDPSPYLDQAPS